MRKIFVGLLLSIGLGQAAQAIDTLAINDLRLHFGGALRFNYRYDPNNKTQAKEGGQFRYDVLSLRPSMSYKQFSMKIDYRLYGEGNGGPMLKYGYFGWRPSEKHYVQLGLVPTLFGLQPNGSHGFMYNINYLIGLEDDADMGIRYTYQNKDWLLGAAFYKNADFVESYNSKARFGFDIGDGLQEINTLHLYASKDFQTASLGHQFGLSALVGQVLNGSTLEMGSRYAVAAHYIATLGNLQFKAQFTNMNIKAFHEGYRLEAIPMVGLGGVYTLEPLTNTINLGIVWTKTGLSGTIDRLSLFSDWSIITKPNTDRAYDSLQAMTGCMIGIGGLETYIELMLARNHPYLGGSKPAAMARGSYAGPYSLGLNINFGYYF